MHDGDIIYKLLKNERNLVVTNNFSPTGSKRRILFISFHVVNNSIILRVFDCITPATLVRDLNAYCHIPLTPKFVIGLPSKELKLTKKMKSTNLLLLCPWIDQSSFIMLFMFFFWLALYLHRTPPRSRRNSYTVTYHHKIWRKFVLYRKQYFRTLWTKWRFDCKWLWQTVHCRSICLLTSSNEDW